MFSFYYLSTSDSEIVSGVSRAKIEEVTLNALRTRQSLVKGERLVRHEVRAVLLMFSADSPANQAPSWLAGFVGL